MIGDNPRRDYPHELTADWTFLRFHHGKRGRDGNYSERELGEWALRIEGWAADCEVFAYFNNDWNGYAIGNALFLTQASWTGALRLTERDRRQLARGLVDDPEGVAHDDRLARLAAGAHRVEVGTRQRVEGDGEGTVVDADPDRVSGTTRPRRHGPAAALAGRPAAWRR